MNHKFLSAFDTRRPIAVLVIVMALFAACQPSESSTQPSASAGESAKADVSPPSFSEQDLELFHELLDVVLNMKTPMSGDDPVGTDAMIEQALSILERTESEWAQALRSDFQMMRAAVSLDRKRIQFEAISAAMIFHTKENPPTGESLYVHSCPMVRDGSADWLSREKEILNPYHGSRMLHCGFVKDEIASAS